MSKAEAEVQNKRVEDMIKRMEEESRQAEIRKKELVDKHMQQIKDESKQAEPCKLTQKMIKNNPARQGKVYDRLYELKKGNAKNFSNLKEDILNQMDAKTTDSEPNYSMIADLGGEQLNHRQLKRSKFGQTCA